MEEEGEGAHVFVFYHWISSSTDMPQVTFIACMISLLFTQVNSAEIPGVGPLQTWHEPWLVTRLPLQFGG